jgi:Haem-binding uptake, Tiki superfamily, ChaN
MPALVGVCVAVGLAVVVIAGVAVMTARPANRPNPSFQPALPALAEAMERDRVVLIGETHGWSTAHRFLRRLVAYLAARGAVDDIVVEFGNARFQPLVDRYIAGAAVPESRVQRAWLETTQGSVWAAPDYAAFFKTVRRLNKKLPIGQKLRVLLGDPPYDPGRGVDPDILQRDDHFAYVIHRKVVARGRRALAIAGIGHVLRQPSPHPTLANLLEGRVRCEPDPLAVAAGVDLCNDLAPYAPIRTYIAVPHLSGVQLELPSQRERPSMATVAETSLGARPLSDVLGDYSARDEGRPWTLEQATDAYLVLDD